jgi:hypothetical protein
MKDGSLTTLGSVASFLRNRKFYLINDREWQAKGEETCVNVYDFLSLADGKAVPYGIYDLVHKKGFGSAGHRP